MEWLSLFCILTSFELCIFFTMISLLKTLGGKNVLQPARDEVKLITPLSFNFVIIFSFSEKKLNIMKLLNFLL